MYCAETTDLVCATWCTKSSDCCNTELQVLLGDNCHIYNYEAGGISALGGVAFHVLHNEANGEILLQNLQAAIRYDIAMHRLPRDMQ